MRNQKIVEFLVTGRMVFVISIAFIYMIKLRKRKRVDNVFRLVTSMGQRKKFPTTTKSQCCYLLRYPYTDWLKFYNSILISRFKDLLFVVNKVDSNGLSSNNGKYTGS